ncbi:MAG: transcriptional repressor LexA [Spirochaetes bacterium]|nr:transcriptional repressor LexA [Spirochaetota bacterium]
MKTLTVRQKQILEFLKSYIEQHHYPPSMREISERFSISVRGAYDHIKALERKKYVKIDSNHYRSLVLVNQEPYRTEQIVRVPLLGSVAAGKPLFSEENWERYIAVPAELIGKGNHFALRVQGDSMIGAGIFNGDLAIVRQQSDAENGEIVVAMVEDAVTLKRLYKEKNRIKLQSENPTYPPIYTQSLRILGRLVHLIRSYE